MVIDEVDRVTLDRMMAKAQKLDLSKYGYRITLQDEDERVNNKGVFIYVESINSNNKFNAMYSGFVAHKGEGWSYYYDEQEGFLGGWMDINPMDLINLVKITNYLSSGI